MPIKRKKNIDKATKKKNKEIKINKMVKHRYSFYTFLIYLVGIILISYLFKLQVIEGENYRAQSNTRLTKEVAIEPSRGAITDRTGVPYAGTYLDYNVELYETVSDNKTLNKMAFELISILESNNEKYKSTFPIDINNKKYRYIEGEKLENWKKKNKIPNEASAEEAFNLLKEKYEIDKADNNDIRKILEVRDLMKTESFSKIKPLKVTGSIKRETAMKLEENSFAMPGVTIVSEPKRTYLRGSECSHVIGYTGRISEKEYEDRKDHDYKNNDIIGKTGIEKTFEELLKGKRGKKQVDTNVDGTVTGEYVTEDAVGGSTVMLTIDSKLQQVAEQSLDRTINKMRNGGFGKKYDAKGGAVVVMNVKTGEVLAMASNPTYTPESFLGGISGKKWDEYNSSLAPLMNRAIQGVYAPGSTFKMVTAIAALSEGVINEKTTVKCSGIYHRAHNPVCWIYTSYKVGHGSLNVEGALKNSCNIFFYEMGHRLGADKIAEYSKYLGLGRKTGIEIAGEKTGSVASSEIAESKGQKMTEGGELSAAIGQSYNSFTPIQMARYISTLVNGGKQVKPTIVKSVINSNNVRLSREQIKEIIEQKTGYKDENYKDIEFQKEHLKSVLEGMRSVTGDRGGTAYSVFKDFNIEVGGKTGSAEAGNMTNGLFVGFAPFNNPEIAIVTVIENGVVGFHTAEVVRDIMIEYFGMNMKEIKENMSATTENEYIM